MDKYYNSNKFKQTLRTYEDSIKGNKGQFLDSEELADIAEYYHLLGRDDEAMQTVDYAISMFPGAISPLTFKARMVLITEDNPELAEELAEEIEDKTDIDYHILKAEILVATNEPEEANEYLISHFDADQDQETMEDYILSCTEMFLDYDETKFAELWLQKSELTNDEDYKEFKARILKNKGQFKESERIFNELLDDDPYSASYWDQLSQTQFLQDDIQNSITSSEYALAIDPNDYTAIFNKANGLVRLGNYKEAINYYERYKELCPKQYKSSMSVTISHLYLGLKDPVNAKKWFDIAMKETNNRDETCAFFGMALFENDYIEKAYEMLTKHLPMVDKDWSLGYAYLARCCYELGKPEQEYQRYLKIALERSVDDCREALADIYPPDMAPEDYPKLPPLPYSRNEEQKKI